tara:strand:+ start:65340 stop:66083 length:744 start_codon:yes stop_codon:yes gene_type:complete
MTNKNNRICLVIGGNGIVGHEICLSMKKNGWNVISLSRNKPSSERMINGINYFKGDATQENELNKIIEQIESSIGPIQSLINCACIRPMKNYFEDEIEKFEESIVANSLSLFVPARIIGIRMAKRNKGSIINVSSIYGMRGPKMNIYRESDFETEPDYAYTKSGSIGLTKYLASYFSQSGVRVNSVVLGGIENNQPENFKKFYNDRVPLGRMCNLSEIGGVFIFLSSNSASYITGSIICVDGGWTAT